MAKRKLKIMVSSTVHGFKTELTQICSALEGYGYDVLNNYWGTVYVPPGASPEEACLAAVNDCDFFFGIILPRYGSGITHSEFKKAIELDKPRGFLVQAHIPFARKLLEQYMYSDVRARVRDPDFAFQRTSVLEDTRVIDMYNEAIHDGEPLEKRRWAHEFFNFPEDGMRFIKTEFGDKKRLQTDIEALKNIGNGQ